ncbi:hypothetical protein CHY08_07560 [Rhizobium leguminosarum bv. viciae]|nr:hypothetical protein CHY08_07560 [Rhizobium leguminosarum bv. viciae]
MVGGAAVAFRTFGFGFLYGYRIGSGRAAARSNCSPAFQTFPSSEKRITTADPAGPARGNDRHP